MALLQPKLSLKVAQRQILTPGLMQMVSVLALNKLELKEMINAEIVENPVLEELEEHVPLLDDIVGREAERERPIEEKASLEKSPEERDPFEEIDFGSYFQDYLDPGFRTGSNFEISEKPSFENFLSVPEKLTDHLHWQLGSLNLTPDLREAAEYVIGNLNEDGYLMTGIEELVADFSGESVPAIDFSGAASNGHVASALSFGASRPENGYREFVSTPEENGNHPVDQFVSPVARPTSPVAQRLIEALSVVRNLDPVGIAACTLRECLLLQIASQRREFELIFKMENMSGDTSGLAQELKMDADVANAAESSTVPQTDVLAVNKKLACFDAAALIVSEHLHLLQKRDTRELAKIIGRSAEELQEAIELIRTLDPKPGQRYNRTSTRLIEPDVAFVKRGDEIVIVMNEEDMPTLRLNQGYKKLLTQTGTEKDVKDYVKERYRSALQLMRNIEQRKSTILRTCEAIIRRQPEFLERGVESLRPMMIKEVAEEIGVHPSTVSRAVSNKYVHTAQGVFELRFFFSEGVNGPEGAGTPLMLLKRKVKKLIEDENPQKPLTDDQIAAMLQDQGIRVTRRTVAKYREDLNIPSTHQRRVRA
jgi:RNA polymerase sigma-54 factor